MRSRVSFCFFGQICSNFRRFWVFDVERAEAGKTLRRSWTICISIGPYFFGIYAKRCFKLTILIPFLRPLSRLVQFSTAPSLTVSKLKLLRLWPKISFYVRGQWIEKWKDRIFDQLNLLFPFDRFIDTTIPIIVSFPEYCFLLGSLEA